MNQSMIVSDPAVMMGKPVATGTRIPIELILEKLGAGETFDQLLEAHPNLNREGILEALEFGARAFRAALSDICLALSGQRHEVFG